MADPTDNDAFSRQIADRFEQVKAATDPQQRLLLYDAIARDVYRRLKNAGHEVQWRGEELMVDGRAYVIGDRLFAREVAPKLVQPPADSPMASPIVDPTVVASAIPSPLEGPAFWGDLESRFRAAAPKAPDLHAIHDRTDFQALLADARQRAAKVREDPLAHPTAAESMAKYAEALEAEAPFRSDPRGYWMISGGPDRDKQEREVLKAGFEVLAEQAALGAGIATKLTPNQAVQQWLHLLKDTGSPFLRFFGLDRLHAASALMCQQLGNQARRDAQTVVAGVGGSSEGARAKSDGDKVGGSRLAAWLTSAMHARDHMSVNRLHKVSGLDRKTIRKMLAGELVRRNALNRLAEGLSQDGAPIAMSDIPID